MKPLNVREISLLVNQINEKIKENHISNITVVNSTDFIFTFSYYRKEKLYLSLNHNAPIIGFITVKDNVPTILGKYNEIFRNEIKDTLLKVIETPYNDRIIRFKLSKTDEFYAKHDKYLVFEMIPHHPNLIILNENEEIIFATHYTDLTSDRLIVKGSKYVAPTASLTKNAEVRDNLAIQIQETYDNSLLIRNKEKFDELGEYIKHKIKVAEKKKLVLLKEIKEAEEKLVYQEHANMLLTYQYNPQEFNNYLLANHFPYDSSKSKQDNINNLFKLYKKAKLTVQNDKDQIALTEKDLNDLYIDLDIYQSGDEEKIVLLKNKYPKLIKTNKAQVTGRSMPYYFDIDGTRYAYGRNAEQNDFLTHKLAKKDYYFFHIKDFAGAHVIIMKSNPSDYEKELAAELAIYASNKDIGEVTMSQVKDIKKGHKPGQVILDKFESAIIKKIDDRIKQGYKASNRYSF